MKKKVMLGDLPKSINKNNERKMVAALSELAVAIEKATASHKKLGYITVKVGFYEQNNKAGK